MPRVDRRAACRRGLTWLVALVLSLAPVLTEVRAQDAAPVAGAASIASSGEVVLLRDQPGYDAAVLTSLGDGSPLDVTGAALPAADGSSWLPVVAGGQSGYVPAGYVAAPAAAPAPSAAQEATAPETVAPLAAPDPAAPAPAAAAAAPAPGAATTTSEANLRAGPSMDAEVFLVLPPGTAVSVDGAASNGFVPVTGWGVSGWVATELLSGAAPLPAAPVADPNTTLAPADASAPAPDPNADAAAAAPAPPPDVTSVQSTNIIWPFAGGEWHVVQGYNGATHNNRGGFAQYHYSLDWARVDGDTAGQPVFAPVSGTIRWTDRGSGGILVDAGNGYGVALFHVTVDGGLGRGDSVERGQRIGRISGPGGDGYMSMAHIEIAAWRLTDGGHESVPFVGPNAIAGQEFPDSGGANQHMGATVSP